MNTQHLRSIIKTATKANLDKGRICFLFFFLHLFLRPRCKTFARGAVLQGLLSLSTRKPKNMLCSKEYTLGGYLDGNNSSRGFGLFDKIGYASTMDLRDLGKAALRQERRLCRCICEHLVRYGYTLARYRITERNNRKVGKVILPEAGGIDRSLMTKNRIFSYD